MIILNIIIDIILINSGLFASFYMRFGTFPERNFIAYKEIWPLISIIYVILLSFNRLYDSDKEFSYLDLLYFSISASVLGFFAISALAFFARSFAFPRSVLAVSVFLNILFISSHHLFLKYIHVISKIKIAILGAKNNILEYDEEIRKYSNIYEVGATLFLDELIDSKDALKNTVISELRDKKIKNIMINASDLEKNEFTTLTDVLMEDNIDILVVPGIYEVLMGKISLKEIAGIPCWEFNSVLPSWTMIMKRIIDILFSFIGILFFVPFFPFVVIAIKLNSRGNIFYIQEREGLNGKPFNIYKFRTMRNDAESDTGPVWASEEDPRITKVGKIMRKYRIDEIPQLINILMGDMSLVGPRPERSYFVEKFSEKYSFFKKRTKVKPGLTGLAQIQGRYESNPEIKLKYDLLYIQNISLMIDFKIIFSTIRVVLNGKGS